MSGISRPGRLTTPATAEYWRAAADGRLVVQGCRACGHQQLYPRTLCRRCWSEHLEWRQASGAGRIETFTVVEAPGHPAWRDSAPYAIAVVALDEGPTLLTGVAVDDPYQLRVGDRVRFVADDGGDPAGPLPFFTPDES